jgi:hypothetical protein
VEELMVRLGIFYARFIRLTISESERIIVWVRTMKKEEE